MGFFSGLDRKMGEERHCLEGMLQEIGCPGEWAELGSGGEKKRAGGGRGRALAQLDGVFCPFHPAQLDEVFSMPP